MRILHVNKFLYRRGGAEAYMLDLAELQRGIGHDVELFGMQHPMNPPHRFQAWFPSTVDFDPPPSTAAGKLRGAGRMLWSSSAASGMSAVLERFAPDLVHLHNVYHQLSPSILHPIRSARVPAVMTLHDYKLACPTYRFLDHGQICEACVPRKFWNAALRRCNQGSFAASALNSIEMTIHTAGRLYGPVHRFVCPSRFLEAKMRESRVFPDRLRWVPNFVDVPAIEPKQTLGAGVVYAGRLSEEKGVDVLIEAATLQPSLSVEIAGDGPARSELERLAEVNGTHDRIRFHGHLSPHELRALIGSAVALVVPSRYYENMPLAVLEGFAVGVPVVASALGGLTELIDPGTDGAVVPPNDPGALAEALGDLLSSPARAFEMGQAGRAKAEREFAPDRHLDRLDRIYDEAIRVAAARPAR
jgi:glycosyltransferase involved in cell wall biosynthesis